MKKIIIVGTIIFVTFTAGCSNQKENAEVETKNFATHEEYKSWYNNETFGIGSLNFTGEIGKFAFVNNEVFRVETEKTYTWYYWADAQGLIGKTVDIYGISEKNKGEELLIATGEIQEATTEEKMIPDSDNLVKIVANIKPIREGKWKLKPYLEEQLLGITVVNVSEK
ncbi:hypothetical protein ACFYKT_21900 [Cytobacillus sp. FJAT-53684]|uniref:DUF4871 domain-containing protein n=1 Tax=Cytobacillus mangrovibacter TaxID=3299024 RepID=A0ABW6K445_9BACI